MEEKKIQFQKVSDSALKQVFRFLSGNTVAPDTIYSITDTDICIPREIAVLLFFISGKERCLILSTGYDTAMNIVRLFQKGMTGHEDEKQMKRMIKDCLGETVNILASKIAGIWNENASLRVTTPSIVFGKELSIDPDMDATYNCCFMTPSGPIELTLTEYNE